MSSDTAGQVTADVASVCHGDERFRFSGDLWNCRDLAGAVTGYVRDLVSHGRGIEVHTTPRLTSGLSVCVDLSDGRSITITAGELGAWAWAR